MKITPEHYDKIKSACMSVLTSNGLHPYQVNSNLHAWQVFHKAGDTGLLNRAELYKLYNDNHIETALKHIFKR